MRRLLESFKIVMVDESSGGKAVHELRLVQAGGRVVGQSGESGGTLSPIPPTTLE
jgi:hypothetical protein